MDAPQLLETDTKVLVSGSDIDGIPRGKIMARDKFLKSLPDGFGFCSVVFGWDLHDVGYDPKPPLAEGDSGFADVLAKVDPKTLRRVPWNNNQAHFLLDFCDPRTGEPLPMCPRSLLKRIVRRCEAAGVRPKAGMEFEWFNYCETPETLHAKQGVGLKPLTNGMFGYSLQRPHLNQDFFNEIFDHCAAFNVPLEALHTETGPGVYEAAIQYADALELADRAHLFKMAVKQIGLSHGITACFMAKPYQDQPGCSGHIHISLADLVSGENLFALAPTDAGSADAASPYAGMTPKMQQFVAGVLAGLPSIMAILAPTINSYKRLVENVWAPLTVSYGLENRTTSIRVIAPPTCPPSATRIEVRVPGADVNPYLAVAAIVACGLHGVEGGMALPFPPARGDVTAADFAPLPRTLIDATRLMMAPDSVARKVLGDDFVEHYGATRLHEWRLWSRAVTNWELKRYMETV
ncbi:hypothetical protein HK105_200274 [Polyrhizophydium stewartii]|uniref:Glutamine synthetase n=1 Tax=Polyrhizophydium stewartii TaxID=2732419 RepID=A0ABR4NL63_9FUNG|nr:hypothetical protein HK105_001972 [Polyrhizophydium stewartii]